MSTTSAKPASLKDAIDEMTAHLELAERAIKPSEVRKMNYWQGHIEASRLAIRLLEALEAQPIAEKTALAEIRKRIERESYWCEDCQHEIPKRTAEGADYMDDFHADHEVVRITVIEVLFATEIDAQKSEGATA